MKTVDVIFNLLDDGKWHSLTEIADKSGFHKFKLEIVTNFLAEYNFIRLDTTKRKVRLTVSLIDFLKKVKHIEKDEG